MIAVLSETLRIFPVVPSGLPRRIPEGGAMINGEWVPPGVSFLYPAMIKTMD